MNLNTAHRLVFPRWLLYFLPALTLVALFSGYLLVRGGLSAPVASDDIYDIPINEEVEKLYGIRFTFAAVTAKGGMVDLRWRVIDADRANNFGHYSETTPVLIAESNGQRLETTIMGFHNHRIEPGRIYYALYRNTANAVQPGSRLSIQIGDLVIEDVIVR